MDYLLIAFILGLSVMFFGMTSWLFFRKGGRLSIIVASLMALLSAQCFISLWFILKNVYLDELYWSVMTSIDIVAVPFYALILRELVRPGTVTYRVGLVNVMPFCLLAVLYCATELRFFYWIMIGGACFFGTSYLIWTHINIIKYNHRLKEQYSFTENINLDWLRKILWFFFVLLTIWIADTITTHAAMECFYLTASMVMWMVIDFFIYKHETVIESLETAQVDYPHDNAEEVPSSELGSRIEHLFIQDRIFLNPNLKISDVAAAVGSNRTYVSNYFNREAATTFYDYVNALRIEYACELLKETQDSIKVVAERAGYNSSQSFIRVFSKIKGISPSEFRQQLSG